MAAGVSVIRGTTNKPVSSEALERFFFTYEGCSGQWLDSLCETVAQHDPMYTVELEAHWRQRMKEGIDFIVAKY